MVRYPGKGWHRRKHCRACIAAGAAGGIGHRSRPEWHRKDHCESCGWTPPTVKALEVDHVIPRSEGGTSDPSNLRTFCPNCHRLKTLAERGLLAA